MLHHIRERIEEGEFRLSPLAAKARYSRGRQTPEDPSPVRTDFQRDRDRITHSKAFRRLKHKTQVFIAPSGDHYVTRLTHTLITAQIARTIARALNLSEDLTEAIVLGHDLGHAPFGHGGEEMLGEMCCEGFRHNEQSLRVVDVLENNGAGLNLTWEVRDGILKHSKVRASVSADAWGLASTVEGQIVKLADSIAYINHDIGDAIRAGMLSEDSLPSRPREVLGKHDSERINSMVCDVIEASFEATRAAESSLGQTAAEYNIERERIEEMAKEGQAIVRMSANVLSVVDELREFLFQKVYLDDISQGNMDKAREVLRLLYNHFRQHPESIPGEFRLNLPTCSVDRAVCDYVAGMTDRYALKMFEDIFMPRTWAPLA